MFDNNDDDNNNHVISYKLYPSVYLHKKKSTNISQSNIDTNNTLTYKTPIYTYIYINIYTHNQLLGKQ